MKASMLAGLVLAVTCDGAVVAQQAAPGVIEYFLLAATRTTTMTQELNAAAGRNYRVVSAAGGVNFNEVVVVMQPGAGGYQYRLVATERTSTLQDELTAAGLDGYRVIPRTVTTKRNASLFNANDYEMLVILEKGPDGARPIRYRVLATSRTGTLQNELKQAGVDGWSLVTLLIRGEVLAILEKAE